MAYPKTPAWVGNQMLESVDNQLPKGLGGSNIKSLDEDKKVGWWELQFNTFLGTPTMPLSVVLSITPAKSSVWKPPS